MHTARKNPGVLATSPLDHTAPHASLRPNTGTRAPGTPQLCSALCMRLLTGWPIARRPLAWIPLAGAAGGHGKVGPDAASPLDQGGVCREWGLPKLQRGECLPRSPKGDAIPMAGAAGEGLEVAMLPAPCLKPPSPQAATPQRAMSGASGSCCGKPSASAPPPIPT